VEIKEALENLRSFVVEGDFLEEEKASIYETFMDSILDHDTPAMALALAKNFNNYFHLDY